MDKLLHSKRIVVYGPSGSGKTYLSAELSKLLNIPYFSLDDYFWKEGWVESTREEFLEQVLPILERDKWILDGNYSEIRPYSLKAADFAIIVNSPFVVCLWRLIIRTVFRNLKLRKKNITPMPKKIRERDIKLKHILPTIKVLASYAWKFHKRGFHLIFSEVKEYLAEDQILVVRNPKKYIKKLKKQLTS